MRPTHIIPITLLTLGCTEICLFGEPDAGDPYLCAGNPDETDPCQGVGETGESECTPHFEPVVDGSLVSCDGEPSEVEVMNDHVASLYGVTDYALEADELSNAGIVDFQAVPDDWLDAGWWASAFPGVVTHDGFDGETKAAYLGRLCCPQWVVENADPLSSPIASPTCQHSGELMHDTPDAWCQAIDTAGFCVFPCDTDEDCPNQILEFCDLTYPNPGNARQGVCRYHSMPSIPTPLNEVMP